MGAIARCKLFVGSSKEGRDLAYAVRQQLKDVAEVDIWSDGIFEVGESGLGSLISALKKYDFAVLVLTPDDETISRGRKESAPRDNVIFEAGMFIGKLGSSRTFLLYDSEGKPKIPSDLAGITLAPFVPRSGGGLQAAVGEAVDDIRDKIKKLGPFISLDTPTAGETINRQIIARGKCSLNSGNVAVVIHPVGEQEYYFRSGTVSDAEWQVNLIVGLESGSSGKEYELRAFLNPDTPTPVQNPLSSWPSAMASTPAIRVRRL